MQHLRLVLVGDEVEARRLRIQSVLRQHLFDDLNQFGFQVGDMGSQGVGVHHPRHHRLQVVGGSERLAFDGPRRLLSVLVGVRAASDTVVVIALPDTAIGHATTGIEAERFKRVLDVLGFETVAAFHRRFTVRWFGPQFREELPEVHADLQPLVFRFGVHDLLVVVLGLRVILVGLVGRLRLLGLFQRLVSVLYEFLHVGLGVVFQGESAAFGACDTAHAFI